METEHETIINSAYGEITVGYRPGYVDSKLNKGLPLRQQLIGPFFVSIGPKNNNCRYIYRDGSEYFSAINHETKRQAWYLTSKSAGRAIGKYIAKQRAKQNASS